MYFPGANELTHQGLMMPYGIDDLTIDWIRLPDGTKPLPDPMLIDHL